MHKQHLLSRVAGPERPYHRIAVLSIALLSLLTTASAQPGTNYTFAQSSGTYSAISGGTLLWGGLFGSFDNEVSGAITIPAFNFDGTVRTQMYVSANGFITFGAAPTATNYTPLNTGTFGGAISAFGANLNSTGINPEVRWQVVGNEIVVQWASARRFNLAGTFGFNPEGFNMQIRLNTSTNVIRVVYGSISNLNSATTFQPQVGIRGSGTTFPADVNNRRVGSGAENWATSLAGNANNNTMRFTSAAPSKSFVSGQTYTWTPNCTAPAATLSTAVNCASNNYTASVNVTSIGSAPHVDILGSVSGLIADNVGTGTYAAPAVAIGTSQTITIVHNGLSVCNINLTATSPGPCALNGTCLTPALNIPDNGCGAGNVLSATIPVTAPGALLNTSVLFSGVDLIVSSTWNNDLEIQLISPTGQTRNLVMDRFGNGDNLGIPGTCPASVLRLRDGAAALVNTNQSNVTGPYAPEQSLAGFTGDPNGLWTIRICDDAADDLASLKYVKLEFTVIPSSNPCAPYPITCGASIPAGSTAGAPNTLPSTACPFNGAASTGGTHWWSYAAPSTGEVTFSTCGSASFNTRLSVFNATLSCSAPVCVGMNDDAIGCPGNSSEVRVAVTAGQVYHVAVHGSGAATGTYTLSAFCSGTCSPGVTNDACANAASITSVVADGSSVPGTWNNTCAHVDAPTSVSGAGPVQGLWFLFNAGPNAVHRLHLLTAAESGAYSANGISYALYSGTCAGMGATTQVTAQAVANGTNLLPALTPGQDYRLLVYNTGSLGSAGTFGLLLDHPGVNDASVRAVTSPAGTICGTTIIPQAWLKNLGEATLTSAVLRATIDGGPPMDTPWSGSLATGDSVLVTLQAMPTPSNAHTVMVTTMSPNGVADDLPANDASSSMYDASGNAVRVRVHSDANGAQTTWTIFDQFFFPVATGGPFGNNTTTTTEACLPSTFGDCYGLFIFDSGGDGMCCANGNGFWELRDEQDRTLLRDDFNGTADGTQSPALAPQTAVYQMGHEFCLPAGPVDILANECNIFTNDLLNKVYCSTVAGATNYQFEFSEPDGGFLRRIGVPRNWVRFNEMVTYPLLPGVKYFCRARPDLGPTGYFDDHFGGGCEMGINPLVVPGCTQLIDNPSLPTHSCGVVKTFGGSDKIWAQPVVNGTLTKFRFTNAGEGFVRVIQRPNYICVLNWVTFPLQNGSTYSVDVNMLVNGQWSGYCGTACDVTIMNPPEQEGRSAEFTDDEEVETVTPSLLLYPNPATDGRVNLRVDGLGDGTHAGELMIMDIQGRLIQQSRISVEGTSGTLPLEAARELAPGQYQVILQLDGAQLSQRLVVH